MSPAAMNTVPGPERSRLVPMRPRDPHEPGRTASSLELFFDLVFVVAVGVAADELRRALTEGHVVQGVLAYLVVFFGIWWAWMNFTWFATSFDTDDWLYRVTTIVQMAGVLVLAAGVHAAFADADYTILVIGYVIMRVAMVAQWLRASRGAGERRRTAQVYAAGIAVVQVLWLVRIALPAPAALVALIVLIAAELGVPLIAERHGNTPRHPHHITERYGLFTLILLGESLLASADGVIEALQDRTEVGPLISIAALALVVTAALWWIYFSPPHHESIRGFARSLRYGYTHYVVFAAAGALSSGVGVEVDVITRRSTLGGVAASFTVTVPIATFMLGIWWIAIRDHADRVVNAVVPAGAVLVLLDPVVPVPVSLTAVIVTGVVVVLVLRPPGRPAPH